MIATDNSRYATWCALSKSLNYEIGFITYTDELSFYIEVYWVKEEHMQQKTDETNTAVFKH